MTPPLSVVHLITELDVGGTEIMLAGLVSRMDRRRVQSEVVSLAGPGPIGDEIAALGVPVQSAGMTRGLTAAFRVARVWRILRGARPAVLQCWLYHASLVGLVAGRAAGVRTIVWSVQNTWLDPALSRAGTRLVARASAPLSPFAAALVSPSRAALQSHLDAGYRNPVLAVIPNGFDTDRFRPDPAARDAVRRELQLPPDARLIGLVARFAPQKDHYTFLRAAGQLLHGAGCPETPPVFVLCGLNVDLENKALGRIAAEVDVAGAVRFLGLRRDVPRITAALDIAVSSSAGQEAFPLTVGEAMACGVPTVVTNVGDSPFVVGDTGIVVPPRDPGALAAAWRSLLRESPDTRAARGRAARARVAGHFSLDVVARQYEDFYESLVSRPGTPAGIGGAAPSAE